MRRTPGTPLPWRNRQKKPAEEGAKESLEIASAIIAIAIKLSVGIGLLALALYLGAAQHVVAGFDLADVFLLAAVVIVLGLLGILITGLGTAIALPYVNFAIAPTGMGAQPNQPDAERIAAKRFAWLAVLFAVGVPGMAQLLVHADTTPILVFLATVAFAAWAVAGRWVDVQARRRRAAARPWDRVDVIGERITTALMLFASGFLLTFVPTLLAPNVLLCFILIGAFFSFGLVLQGAQGPLVKKSWTATGRKAMAAAVAIASFIALLLPAFNKETGVSKAFQAISLYVPSATVEVSAANLARLERVAGQHGAPLQVCHHADGTATLTDMRVLWHTLGDSGLVELGAEPTTAQEGDSTAMRSRARYETAFYERALAVLGWRGVRVRVENKGFEVIPGSTLRCVEISGLEFASNSPTLDSKALAALHTHLATLKASLQSGNGGRGAANRVAAERLDIVGHADPRKRVRGTNEALAQERASAVEREVRSWIEKNAPEWKALPISARSAGPREVARKCEGEGEEAQACHAFNRRVVLQLLAGPAREQP